MRCKRCVHSIFDEKWAEYKCKLKQRRIYNSSEANQCKDYQNKRREKK